MPWLETIFAPSIFAEQDSPSSSRHRTCISEQVILIIKSIIYKMFQRRCEPRRKIDMTISVHSNVENWRGTASAQRTGCVRLARVFPRRTNATPDDAFAFDGRYAPGLFDEFDRVEISVAFDWDKAEAERLANLWSPVCGSNNVTIGGPAYGDHGGEFTPGRYLKRGYTITSRGCQNACWFCRAWRSEGRVMRELEIKDGFNVLDNNLLACSDGHVKAVFDMLERQPEQARFTGGLEAARLEPWHCERLASLKPKVMWFAYDEESDREPLLRAGRLLYEAGLINSSNSARCYVLCGYEGDTFEAAEARLNETMDAGFLPMAMLFNQRRGKGQEQEWRRFQREWASPIIVGAKKRQRAPVPRKHNVTCDLRGNQTSGTIDCAPSRVRSTRWLAYSESVITRILFFLASSVINSTNNGSEISSHEMGKPTGISSSSFFI